MNRDLALKIVLALVGLLFLALAYPMIVFVRQDPALSMMFSIYVTLGVFLLLAIRNPLASRSLMQSIFSPAARRDTRQVQANVDRRGGELKMDWTKPRHDARPMGIGWLAGS